MKQPACSLNAFKDLKKALEQRNATPGEKAENIKGNAGERHDEEIFSEAMADVREIKEFRKIPFRSPQGIRPRAPRVEDGHEVLRQIVCGERKIRLSDTGEYMEWIAPDIKKDIAGKLHQGHFSVQDSIDLHGMSLAEAEHALTLFFREAVRKRLFCIKVIHGRGLRSPKGPVLKEAFKRWLHGPYRKWVLAYATAKDCDGGLGATYIIIK
jgi:DNA-nicking Smr family endonuclease